MTDNLTARQRKYNMQRIRSEDTHPEMAVRSIVHGMGFRYRLHCSKLPGRPDLALPRHKKIIFVHGYFWHMHKCRYGRVVPMTNIRYWQVKREKNVTRDKGNMEDLRHLGWRVFVTWECWLRNTNVLEKRLASFLLS